MAEACFLLPALFLGIPTGAQHSVGVCVEYIRCQSPSRASTMPAAATAATAPTRGEPSNSTAVSVAGPMAPLQLHPLQLAPILQHDTRVYENLMFDEATQVLILIRHNTFFLLDIDTTDEQQGASLDVLGRISEPLTFIRAGPVVCARLSYDQRFLALQRNEFELDVYDLVERAELRMKVRAASTTSSSSSSAASSSSSSSSAAGEKAAAAAAAAGAERRQRGILPGGIRWCKFSATSHALVLVTYEGLEVHHLSASTPKQDKGAFANSHRHMAGKSGRTGGGGTTTTPGGGGTTLGDAVSRGGGGGSTEAEAGGAVVEAQKASPPPPAAAQTKTTTCKLMDSVERDSRITFHCFFALEHKNGTTSAIIAVGTATPQRQTRIKP